MQLPLHHRRRTSTHCQKKAASFRASDVTRPTISRITYCDATRFPRRRRSCASRYRCRLPCASICDSRPACRPAPPRHRRRFRPRRRLPECRARSCHKRSRLHNRRPSRSHNLLATNKHSKCRLRCSKCRRKRRPSWSTPTTASTIEPCLPRPSSSRSSRWREMRAACANSTCPLTRRPPLPRASVSRSLSSTKRANSSSPFRSPTLMQLV